MILGLYQDKYPIHYIIDYDIYQPFEDIMNDYLQLCKHTPEF